MNHTFNRITRRAALALAIGAALAAQDATAQAAKYGPGASATEIKLGQTMPYSGPASAYGTIGKVEQAYFKMINDNGGINGRKINLISLDDGYSPPKAVEQVRRLVEQEEVLALFQTLGTPSNSAIHKYVNAKKVPQLLLATGATKWGDPKDFPWTMGFNLSYQSEGQIYAKWLLKNKPDAKIAVLYQNDDYGKDVLKGVKDGLGAAGAKMIVKEATYEVTDPTIDSQILTLQGSGADTFINITTPKFGAQAIRKAFDSAGSRCTSSTTSAPRSARCWCRRASRRRSARSPSPTTRTRTTRSGRTTRRCSNGAPSWAATTARATRRTRATSTATSRRRSWCRS